MCGLCDGTESINSIGSEGDRYSMERFYDEEAGRFMPYFIITQFDEYDNLKIVTFTPDLNVCPQCGSVLS